MSTQDNINEIAKVIQKALTAQEAASRGLVPQSGNPDKPGRWVRDPKADGKTSSQDDRKTMTSEDSSDGSAVDEKFLLEFVSDFVSNAQTDDLGRITNLSPANIRATKKTFDIMTDKNQHGLAATIVTDTYGTKSEKDMIRAINTAHDKSSTGIDPNDQRIRDAIVNKYKSQLNQDPDNSGSTN